ncbi:phage head closure protein [Staphylococcus chromogenes]|uniref:phage head closure protein n=1 Tax=Staphylococcus chromogenes TaxID=46126 RepID=UPI000D19DD2E|nr:phage head closure protein [Staphylococcus chromogenes]PTF49656.1 phage head-tail adapter protein [Staphylococcus chromogenes]PTF57692.1 phage head-tail adapter protein [Staphylococcus chromogenes]PTF65061.1 phage head-tail adapter protein [Staphylococcus chromogenes]PTF76535.1 phage head-tail adapter protein [Staphylococcus chromogenes]PTF90340.1 phage head-tail adapter protein [Staphylococcus chromogenes]
MFDPFDEYPHTITKVKKTKVNSYPNPIVNYEEVTTFNGFMDTPTTSETLKYHQMGKSFDRNLYTRYDIPINTEDYFKYEGRIYQIIGYPVDQGGMHEVNLTRLQEVPYGKG